MATIVKRGNRWQAKVRKKGVVRSQTFETKQRAQQWATKIEYELDAGRIGRGQAEAERTTLVEALDRYLKERLPEIRGARQLTNLVAQLKKCKFRDRTLASISPPEISIWKNELLTGEPGREPLSSQSIVHRMNLLSAVYNRASGEWGMESLNNPVRRIRRPKLPAGRDRRLEVEDYRRLRTACNESPSKWLRPMVSLALFTAMRQGELLRLRWEDIDWKSSSLLVKETKNGSPRTVPLSIDATRVLRALGGTTPKLGKIFPVMTGHAVTHAFAKVCKAASISDFRFHDLRHEATSRFFEKKKQMSDVQIASITGHKNMMSLKRYAHLRAKRLAAFLD